LGEIKKNTWPTGFAVNYHYKNGYLSAVEQSTSGNIIWELNDMNAQGQITQYMLGNGLLTTKGFDTYGFPSSIFTENGVQNHTYEFNENTGNLTVRSSVIYPPHGSHTLTENFTYDDTEFKTRLETWKVDIGQLNSIGYNSNGNIESKTGVGTFVYKSIDEGPHAVSLIDEPSDAYLENAIINEQHLAYTDFDKTKTIWNENPANPETSKVLEITYGPNQSRYKTEISKNGEKIKTKYYIGGLLETEQDANNNTRKLHYINAGDGLCAIYVINNNNDDSMYYIHKDYLGSIETITNEDAVIVERLSFDPWGRRRNVTNWSYDNVPTSFLFDRGFTGHEHIDEFNLINMNGRVYDPMLSRFLSPDNLVQAPYYTQSFNRYSYVLNNPLKFTDPSGEYAAMLGALGIFMFGSIVDHLVSPGDYNDKNIGDAIVNGAKDGLHAFDEINSVTSVSVYQDENWNVSVGLSTTGLGVNAGVSYTNGDWTLGTNIGSGFNMNPETNINAWESSIGGGVTYYDDDYKVGFTVGATRFGGVHNQSNWILGIRTGEFSASMTNDYLISPEDKWRTAAAEIGWGDATLGFNVYTTEHGKESDGRWCSKAVGCHKHNLGAYLVGSRLASPAYIGLRRNGFQYRIGVDSPWVQDFTQNLKHRSMKETPFFRTDYGTPARLYSFYGIYNPYTLY